MNVTVTASLPCMVIVKLHLLCMVAMVSFIFYQWLHFVCQGNFLMNNDDVWRLSLYVNYQGLNLDITLVLHTAMLLCYLSSYFTTVTYIIEIGCNSRRADVRVEKGAWDSSAKIVVQLTCHFIVLMSDRPSTTVTPTSIGMEYLPRCPAHQGEEGQKAVSNGK